jgi:hypothetical protein
MPKGLSDQYVVVDRMSGEEARGVFVIDPVNDPHARAALIGYAHDVEEDDWKLANDLRLLVQKLETADRAQRQRISGTIEIPDWLLQQSRDQEDRDQR